MILKNPSAKDEHPTTGGVHPVADLESRPQDQHHRVRARSRCGRVRSVKLVQGHHLRSNQYLLVRVYNEDEARRNWARRSIKPADGEAADDRAPAIRACRRSDRRQAAHH